MEWVITDCESNGNYQIHIWEFEDSSPLTPNVANSTINHLECYRQFTRMVDAKNTTKKEQVVVVEQTKSVQTNSQVVIGYGNCGDDIQKYYCKYYI